MANASRREPRIDPLEDPDGQLAQLLVALKRIERGLDGIRELIVGLPDEHGRIHVVVDTEDQ